jgi:hypothetical protein
MVGKKIKVKQSAFSRIFRIRGKEKNNAWI